MSKKKKFILIYSIVISVLIAGIASFLTFTEFGKYIIDVSVITMQGRKINFEGSFEDLKGLENQLENYDLYLSGEAHGIQLSYKMEKYMATYFMENHGVRNIVEEMPFSAAEMLNEYLDTGDETTLNNILNKFKTTFSDNQDTYDLYKFYYEYNKTLPVDNKLTFVGVDIERVPEATGIYINRLIKDVEGEPSQDIAEMVKEIKIHNNFYDRFFLNDLCKSLEENTEEYEKYLGDKFFYFDLAVRNIMLDATMEEREVAMIENFQAYYEKLGGGKYYGQCGRAHVIKTTDTGDGDVGGKVSSFAYGINNDFEPLKGKVYSMIYLYSNSYSNHGGFIDSISDISLPESRADGEVRIYNSKENKKVYQVLKKYGFQGDDIGELLFIIRDSKAADNLRVQ